MRCKCCNSINGEILEPPRDYYCHKCYGIHLTTRDHDFLLEDLYRILGVEESDDEVISELTK